MRKMKIEKVADFLSNNLNYSLYEAEPGNSRFFRKSAIQKTANPMFVFPLSKEIVLLKEVLNIPESEWDVYRVV